MSGDRSELILVAAPVGRDAELTCEQLSAHGLRCRAFHDLHDLCASGASHGGAIVVTEEALQVDSVRELDWVLAAQPAWSEIPIVVLTAPAPGAKSRALDAVSRRTNVTLIDRPVRIKSLVSAVHSALRARQRQYDIRDLMTQLEERVRERDRFLAVLGHELRNPLGAILLASQMRDENGMLDGNHAELIERQSRHLTQLVNDLLDLSRVAAGKIVLKRQIVDLRDAAAESMRVLGPIADRERVSVAMDRCEQPLLVSGDPVRLDQIISNVLSNAIKYTPAEGHVRVAMYEEAGEAVICVTDDGVGIAPDRIGVVFELFAQAENAIGRAQGGMGIGLSLVRSLVRLHDGRVDVKSDGVGKGSAFTIHLPLATREEVESHVPSSRFVSSDGEGTNAPRKIAIVEDNDDVRDLLSLKLARLGHQVVTARDGAEGIELLVSERPDLALVDLGLPGIDGFGVARETREQLGPDVILVAVSGFGQPDDKRRALESGFDEHITKPADVKDIENVLRKFPPRNGAQSPVES